MGWLVGWRAFRQALCNLMLLLLFVLWLLGYVGDASQPMTLPGVV